MTATPSARTFPGPDDIMKVANTSSPRQLGGAIAHMIRAHGRAQLQILGANAGYAALKAIAIANRFLEAEGLEVTATPWLEQGEVDGMEKTVLRIRIELKR